MNDRRAPSSAPQLPGHTYVRLLGLGGFADVFLYRQHLPARDVAVKVLLADHLDSHARERFVTEANLMAQVSQHPAIVTVHHADFAADGRPYLVMEYCSRPGLAERYRSERMSLGECLRIGIRLASAVQTAHSVGILHRDIKPANVLTTDFGWPALTDFGIAATVGRTDATVGMSIPWAPPEMLAARPSGDERSDVYSLAATVYSVLAGRSPFEVVGTANTAAELVTRIERMPLPRIGRADVPPALHAVLAQALDKQPARRHASAMAFARALQDVESAAGLPVTGLDLPDSAVPRESVQLTDDATRVRPVLAGDRPDPDDGTRPRPVLGAPVADPPVLAAPWPVAPDSGSVVSRGPGTGVPDQVLVVEPVAPTPSPRRRPVLIAAATVVLVVLAAVGARLFGDRRAASPAGSDYTAARVTVAPAVPAPASVTGVRAADGSVTFTWTDPDPAAGDRFVWALSALGDQAQRTLVAEPRAVLGADQAQGRTCIEVWIVRADGRTSAQSGSGCAA